MIEYTNECVGCAVPAYPCMGDACPNRHVPHYYCDSCEKETDTLYQMDDMQLCSSCLMELSGEDSLDQYDQICA